MFFYFVFVSLILNGLVCVELEEYTPIPVKIYSSAKEVASLDSSLCHVSVYYEDKGIKSSQFRSFAAKPMTLSKEVIYTKGKAELILQNFEKPISFVRIKLLDPVSESSNDPNRSVVKSLAELELEKLKEKLKPPFHEQNIQLPLGLKIKNIEISFIQFTKLNPEKIQYDVLLWFEGLEKVQASSHLYGNLIFTSSNAKL